VIKLHVISDVSLLLLNLMYEKDTEMTITSLKHGANAL
jgi:hypothetical protein